MSTLPLETAVRQQFEVDHIEGEEMVARCKWHADTGRPNLYVNGTTGLYYCFVCGARGKVDGALSASDHISALRRRLQALGSPVEPVDGIKPEGWLRQFTAGHSYWSTARGFNEATINSWQLGYDPNTNRLTIPIRTAHGQLLGAIYRAWDDGKPKYLHPRGFRTGQHLFGAHLVGDRKRVALVEGPLDAIACWHARVPALAVYGARLTEGQVDLLHYLGVRVLVPMFDRDRPGTEAEMRVLEIGPGNGFIVRTGEWPSPTAKDPAELRSSQRRSFWLSAGGV